MQFEMFCLDKYEYVVSRVSLQQNTWIHCVLPLCRLPHDTIDKYFKKKKKKHMGSERGGVMSHSYYDADSAAL